MPSWYSFLKKNPFNLHTLFSSSYSVFSMLRDQLEHCPLLLESRGSNVNSIIGEEIMQLLVIRRYFSDSDEIMNCGEAGNLSEDQKYQIQELFTQGVKHKMRMNFVRQMSKTSSKMKYSYLRDYRV